jgi:fibronectin type 3 domain-containing protein
MEKEGMVDAAHIANMAGFGDPNTLHLKGYNVYMSEVSGGRFEKVNAQPLSNVPSYLVRKLKVGQKYYFKYSSVGLDGSESRLSDEVSAMALPQSAVQATTSSVSTPAGAALPEVK